MDADQSRQLAARIRSKWVGNDSGDDSETFDPQAPPPGSATQAYWPVGRKSPLRRPTVPYVFLGAESFSSGLFVHIKQEDPPDQREHLLYFDLNSMTNDQQVACNSIFEAVALVAGRLGEDMEDLVHLSENLLLVRIDHLAP